MDRKTPPQTTPVLVYSPMARMFHWLTVALVATMIPLGFYMVWRGETTRFDALTARLYETHKLLGFVVLALVVLRLGYRLNKGAPADEPTLEWWQKAAAHLTHWGLYGLLLLVPLLGWIGISKYAEGTTLIFNTIRVPRLSSVDADTAQVVFTYHLYGAVLLLLLIGAHIGAAVFHHAIRKDGVLRRMLPNLKQRP